MRETRQRWRAVSVAPRGRGCLWPPAPFSCISALCSLLPAPLSNCTYAAFLTEPIHSPESRVAVCQYQKTNCLSHCYSLSSSQKFSFPFFGAVESTLPCLWDFSSPSRIKPGSMALKVQVLTTGQPGNYPSMNCKRKNNFLPLIAGEQGSKKMKQLSRSHS